MIIGIGHDLTEGTRLKATLARFGQRFLDRVYTAEEQARARKAADPVPTLARRWAAKEATAKALGTGIGAQARMHEIAVLNDAQGQPQLILTGAAQQTLARKTPAGHVARLHLSLADEGPLASAYVIIEALADKAA